MPTIKIMTSRLSGKGTREDYEKVYKLSEVNTCYLLISVDDEKFTQKHLSSYILLLLDAYPKANIKIIVGGTIQHYNIMSREKLDRKVAYEKAKRAELGCIAECERLVNKYDKNKKIEIIPWENLKKLKEFNQKRECIGELIKTDESFIDSLMQTSLDYAKRQDYIREKVPEYLKKLGTSVKLYADSIKNSNKYEPSDKDQSLVAKNTIDFLIEECIVFSMLKSGHITYPGACPKVIESVLEPHGLEWVRMQYKEVGIKSWEWYDKQIDSEVYKDSFLDTARDQQPEQEQRKPLIKQIPLRLNYSANHNNFFQTDTNRQDLSSDQVQEWLYLALYSALTTLNITHQVNIPFSDTLIRKLIKELSAKEQTGHLTRSKSHPELPRLDGESIMEIPLQRSLSPPLQS